MGISLEYSGLGLSVNTKRHFHRFKDSIMMKGIDDSFLFARATTFDTPETWTKEKGGDNSFS